MNFLEKTRAHNIFTTELSVEAKKDSFWQGFWVTSIDQNQTRVTSHIIFMTSK